MKSYAHQQKIVDEDPKKAGLFLGTGSGKTRIALMLAEERTLVIAPKTQVDDGNWERELDAIRPDVERIRMVGRDIRISELMITFDKFKAAHETLPFVDTLIVDEAHGMLGLTPSTRWRKKVEIPRASQRYEALIAYIRRVKPKRIYLCTATIMKAPMTVFAALEALDMPHEDFFTFRRRFYTKLPMPGREVWAPKKDEESKVALAALVHSMGYVGRLDDYFDVPEQTFRTIHVELTEAQKDRIKQLRLEYPEPIVRIGKRHQVENGVLGSDGYSHVESFANAKIDKILELALEFPRMVVFAKYTRQIEAIRQALADEGYTAWTLTGDTKDRAAVIAAANNNDGVLVCQAQISAGWELPQTPVMVFASRTYSFVDYEQALGRVQRANAIKKNLYINLVARGGVDAAVDRALENKSDFNEKLYEERS